MPSETATEIDAKPTSRRGNHVLGQLAAGAMGVGVGLINSEHGPLLSTIAGLKQYFYSAIVAVLLIDGQHKLYDRLRQADKESVWPDVLSIGLPVVTIAGSYVAHSLKGTPETVASTIPTVILAPIGYTILHVRRRLQEMQKVKNKPPCPFPKKPLP